LFLLIVSSFLDPTWKDFILHTYFLI